MRDREGITSKIRNVTLCHLDGLAVTQPSLRRHAAVMHYAWRLRNVCVTFARRLHDVCVTAAWRFCTDFTAVTQASRSHYAAVTHITSSYVTAAWRFVQISQNVTLPSRSRHSTVTQPSRKYHVFSLLKIWNSVPILRRDQGSGGT